MKIADNLSKTKFDEEFVDTNGINVKGREEELMGRPKALLTEIEPLSWKFWKKRRFIVVVMCFFGLFNAYTLRVNLSVAIVAMTENRPIDYGNGTVGYEQYFPWDSTQQGLVLSSFFYGYILTQLIGGLAAARFGGNLIFGIGIGATAFLTLLTPLAVNEGGVYTLIAIRTIEGFFEGVTIPCIHAMLAQWAPPLERSRMVTIVFAGMYAGTVVSMPVSGVLAQSLGWESVFYFFGAVGVVWLILFFIIVRNGPENDPWISADERRFIEVSLGTEVKKRVIHPYKEIFKSKPFWAIVTAQVAEAWGFYTLLTQLPTFLKDVLGFDLQGSGFLAAVPYLTLGFLLFGAGYLADWFQMKGLLTTGQVRRYFNSIGFLGQTIFMLAAGYIDNSAGSVICIIIAVGTGAFAWSAFAVNNLDIAPQHASVLMGIGNTFGTIPGIVSPTLTGVIVQNKLKSEWRIVFFITSGIYLFGAIVYWFWASGELQPWAQVDTEDKDTENQTETKLSDNGHTNKAFDKKE